MRKELGGTIKSIRKAKGLTLKELSDKADLSVSFLSMVERGQSSAALVSLKKIADALDENISTFLSEFELQNQETHGSFSRSYNMKIRMLNAPYIYYQLGENNKNFSMDAMVVVLLPGQSREEVIQFRHSGEELTYVLEGVLSFFLNGEEHLLYPGDCYHGFGDALHNFVNLSNNTVKVLYVLTPPLWEEVHSSLLVQEKKEQQEDKENAADD